MLTLADLCEKHGVTAIDFLKIDVEGAEADVLAGNDWTRFRPKVVVVEAIDPAHASPPGRAGSRSCSTPATGSGSTTR